MGTAKKIASLLSIIRGYNILVLIIAQYLAAIFIFTKSHDYVSVIADSKLLYIVVATVLVVAAGYIINNFYDIKADRINRPVKANIDSIVSQETQLTIYFTCNFLAFVFGFLVSWKACMFFSVYIFSIWFYSHKLKKFPVVGMLIASSLTISPFLVLFLYFKNFSTEIFIHASFLYLVILVRELVKNLENIQGLIVSDYTTFAVAYGERLTKCLITLLLALTIIPVFFLFGYPSINYMKYYFYLAGVILIIVSVFVQFAKTKNQYRILHNILKLLLLIGVFSLVFIGRNFF